MMGKLQNVLFVDELSEWVGVVIVGILTVVLFVH
jgi:hypothetical protein